MVSTWFITGTSSGIGRELTERLLRRGDRVAATLRRPERLAELAADHGDRLWVRALDVTDTARLRVVVDEAFAELGRIDVVVSNAGYGLLGAAEELTDEQIGRQVATNLTGAVQLVRAVLPHLRAQGGGRILQLSSMAGHLGVPGMSLYNATKWGVEGFFEALAPEVEPFGVRTTVVAPGMVRTPWLASVEEAPVSPAYADHPAVVRAGFVPLEAMAGDPAKVAAALVDLGEAEEPPRRVVLGSDAHTLVRAALVERLAALDAQEELARSTDADDLVRD